MGGDVPQMAKYGRAQAHNATMAQAKTMIRAFVGVECRVVFVAELRLGGGRGTHNAHEIEQCRRHGCATEEEDDTTSRSHKKTPLR